MIFGVIGALSIQTLLEMSLPIYGQFAERRLNAFLVHDFAFTYAAVIAIGVLVYLLAAFGGLRFEKTVIIHLVNELREFWFSAALYRRERTSSRDKAKLLAKLTYHFSLVQSSLGAAVTGSVRLLINFIALISFAFFAGPLLLSYVLLSLLVCAIFTVIGYYIGLLYLSREASLSTAIITHVSESVDQADILQAQFREDAALHRLRDLVALDSQLKIRRTLWLEFGNRIIFAGLIMVAAGVSIVMLIFPNSGLASAIPNVSLSSGIIFAFLARQLYLSLRIGLYIVPAKVGLVLSLPDLQHPSVPSDRAGDFSTIEFKTKKTKLTPETDYLHNLLFLFERGGRYLFWGEGRVGKSNLAEIFSGQATRTGRPWIIRLDGRRYRYPSWRQTSARSFYVSGLVQGGPLIGEIISGHDRVNISAEAIDNIMALVEATPPLSFLTRLPKFIATPLDQAALTTADIALLQLAHCLCKPYRLIVIDNRILDLPDPRVSAMIDILMRQLPESIIICFSTKRIASFNFSSEYEIKKQTLVKL